MVSLDEDESGAFSRLSIQSILGMNGAGQYEIVGHEVSRTFFIVVPI